MSNQNWSDWAHLDSGLDIPALPGCYQMRQVTDGVPAIIGRWLGFDSSGLLYVGKASSCRQRIGRFLKGYKTGRFSHYAARKLAEWKSKATTDLPVPLIEQIQVRYLVCESALEAGRTEDRIIEEYRNRFGELPPMNRLGGRTDRDNQAQPDD